MVTRVRCVRCRARLVRGLNIIFRSPRGEVVCDGCARQGDVDASVRDDLHVHLTTTVRDTCPACGARVAAGQVHG